MPLPSNDLPPGAPDYARGALVNANPSPTPTPVPVPSLLDRVITMFHPNPLPVSSPARLVGRSDQLEKQLDALQARSSNGR